MTHPVISTTNLSKTYYKQLPKKSIADFFRPKTEPAEAVKSINLNINQGESVAFLGPNGAGKTTTIKMLTGLMYPSSGTISVLGFQPFQRKRDFLMQIGLVMGNRAGLNWDLNINQNFELLRHIYNIPQNQFKSKVAELSQLLDITKNLQQQVRSLSLGERMKAEIIGSILHNPKILFLDEPTIGLDFSAKQSLRTFFRTLQKDFGTTILLTSHDIDDVEAVCDRVVVINHGEIAYDDSLNNLTESFRKNRYITFVFENSIERDSLISQLQKTGWKELNNPEEGKDEKNKKGISNQKQTFEIISMDQNSVELRTSQEDFAPLIGAVTSAFVVKDIDLPSIPLEEIIKKLYQSSSTIQTLK